MIMEMNLESKRYGDKLENILVFIGVYYSLLSYLYNQSQTMVSGDFPKVPQPLLENTDV